MKIIAVAALILPLAVAPPTPAPAGPTPDPSRIISLVSRESAAHACPLPGLVVTNAHVADKAPYRFEQRDRRGTAKSAYVSDRDDLAVLTLDGDVEPYELAPGPPEIGSEVRWVGYDWRKRGSIFGRRFFHGHVSRIVAGHVVIDAETTPGSSGSCVLDEQGRVVAVIAWMIGEKEEAAAIAIGLWGNWAEELRAEAAKAAKKEIK